MVVTPLSVAHSQAVVHVSCMPGHTGRRAGRGAGCQAGGQADARAHPCPTKRCALASTSRSSRAFCSECRPTGEERSRQGGAQPTPSPNPAPPSA